jgi:UDPglucose 6-dehydrogenase
VRRIALIGSGYVGLVTGACLADLGNAVVCVDRDEEKIATLCAGGLTLYEPRLPELIERNARAGRLSFTTDIESAVRSSEIVMIAVGTPADAGGAADLSAVRTVAAEIGRALDGPKIVVSKSTVPLETSALIAALVAENATGEHRVDVVSNPEFLREGSAVADFMQPDRIVIGTSSAHAEAVMRELYAPLGAPILVTDMRTSELMKYAANAFLATKVSFMNEIANICAAAGVDVDTVAHGMGLDPRIGTAFMQPGMGYGGSCLPKDVRALEQLAVTRGYDAPLLRAVETVNHRQRARTFGALVAALGGDVAGKHVAVLGAAFKPNTDDVRDAPALAVIEALLGAEASVCVHDPAALAAVRARFGDALRYAADAYDTLRGADALLLATEWDVYQDLDFTRVRALMRGDRVIDGRNAFDPGRVAAAGLVYAGIGRLTPAVSHAV